MPSALALDEQEQRSFVYTTERLCPAPLESTSMTQETAHEAVAASRFEYGHPRPDLLLLLGCPGGVRGLSFPRVKRLSIIARLYGGNCECRTRRGRRVPDQELQADGQRALRGRRAAHDHMRGAVDQAQRPRLRPRVPHRRRPALQQGQSTAPEQVPRKYCGFNPRTTPRCTSATEPARSPSNLARTGSTTPPICGCSRSPPTCTANMCRSSSASTTRTTGRRTATRPRYGSRTAGRTFSQTAWLPHS